MAHILVIQGPNLNLLGSREPEFYDSITLDELHQDLILQAQTLGHTLTAFQSNSEHEIVEKIQQAQAQNYDFIIINAGAYTHTSIAIRDAFLATEMPFIEVHMTNIYSREKYRHTSYLSDIAEGIIIGMGIIGYQLALVGAVTFLAQEEE